MFPCRFITWTSSTCKHTPQPIVGRWQFKNHLSVCDMEMRICVFVSSEQTTKGEGKLKALPFYNLQKGTTNAPKLNTKTRRTQAVVGHMGKVTQEPKVRCVLISLCIYPQGYKIKWKKQNAHNNGRGVLTQNRTARRQQHSEATTTRRTITQWSSTGGLQGHFEWVLYKGVEVSLLFIHSVRSWEASRQAIVGLCS